MWLANISIHTKYSTWKAYIFTLTLTSCICKKTNIEWFTPKTFITMLPWVFHATRLFQSIPAGLSVELLTSLWGRERVPEMHLSPPERGYWPKTKRWRNETYLRALKRSFLKIESSCSSTPNLEQWPHVMMTTMNFHLGEHTGNKISSFTAWMRWVPQHLCIHMDFHSPNKMTTLHLFPSLLPLEFLNNRKFLPLCNINYKKKKDILKKFPYNQDIG